jgi:hypothetical protein
MKGHSRFRRADAALALAGVVTAAGLGFALWPRPTPTATVDPASVRIDRPIVAASGQLTALIISDSYTAGSGLAETSYGCAAATSMGWLCKTESEAGTGYVSGGPVNRFELEAGSGMSTSFGERISRVAKTYDPDVVILDGGRDDVFAEPEARFAATVRTIAQARQTWPDARVVFVAPRFLDKPEDDLGIDDEVIDLIREASGVDDLVVVDPIAGFDKAAAAPLIARDGTDPIQAAPNQAGERALGKALADALAKEGLRPTT